MGLRAGHHLPHKHSLAMAIRTALHISSVAMLIRRAALHISSVAMLIRRAGSVAMPERLCTQCENGLFAEHSQNFNLFQK